MSGFQRPMDFGGSWYPAEPRACRRAIESYWKDAADTGASTPGVGLPPEARLGIAPHAGWVYSGALAARTFRALSDDPGVALVVVLGGHLRASDPIVATTEGTWDTPFGAFALHGGFDARLARLEPHWERDGRYVADNSTELQLPFAKLKYPAAALLALRVPPSARAVALGAALADYFETAGVSAVVVASTDLTHYGPHYDFTPKGRGPQALAWVRAENDPAFIAAVEQGEPERLLAVTQQRRCACSGGAVATVAEIARSRGERFRTLGYGTSADRAGADKENFVGYLAGVWG